MRSIPFGKPITGPEEPVGPHVCQDDVEYMARCLRDLIQEVSS